MSRPEVKAFFDPDTNTVSYVVTDPATRHCAIVDSVLDYAPNAGRTTHSSARQIVDYVKRENLTVDWLLETHVHADHLSAAPWLQEQVGGKLAIGEHIRTVQDTFGKVFNAGTEFARDGRQFDHLFQDGETYQVGNLKARAIHTPGHTPACMSHLIGDAVFVGDTLFMPDYGTARCDFPGGDARTLYRSIQTLLALPDDTRMFLCHDYLPEGRETFIWETTVGDQRRQNIHVHDGIGEDTFVRMREARDATLDLPRLILPSVQVNMRAGHLPPAESNGTRYLKIPLNLFAAPVDEEPRTSA
ncbi:MAG: MBL fold metallo-hydrolase [Pseudomonadales bacterium]|nr:MBL fold metallo-hydrolase [Pseudomonadales bacterium]